MHDEIIVAARGNRRQEPDMPSLENRVNNLKHTVDLQPNSLKSAKKKPNKLVSKISPDSKSYASDKVSIEQP